MQVNIVQEFAAGDPVPPWLLAYEPETAETSPAIFMFRRAVVVLEAGARYFVVPIDDPDGEAPPVLQVVSKGDVTVFATSRAVAISRSFLVCHPAETGRGDTVTFPPIGS